MKFSLNDVMAARNKAAAATVAPSLLMTQPVVTPALQATPATLKVAGLTLRNVKPIAPAELSPQFQALAATSVAPSAPLTLARAVENRAVQVHSEVTDWPAAVAAPYTNEADELRRLLDVVAATLHTNDVSDAMLVCLQFVADHPEQRNTLLPDDVGMLFQALQSSEGITLAKKEQNQTRGKARAIERTQAADDLAELGF